MSDQSNQPYSGDGKCPKCNSKGCVSKKYKTYLSNYGCSECGAVFKSLESENPGEFERYDRVDNLKVRS